MRGNVLQIEHWQPEEKLINHIQISITSFVRFDRTPGFRSFMQPETRLGHNSIYRTVACVHSKLLSKLESLTAITTRFYIQKSEIRGTIRLNWTKIMNLIQIRVPTTQTFTPRREVKLQIWSKVSILFEIEIWKLSVRHTIQTPVKSWLALSHGKCCVYQ